LDGDDYFFPSKIEAEMNALRQRRDVVAYSDVRIINRKGHVRREGIGDFSRLAVSDRVRWLLSMNRQSPRSMLFPKDVHLRIGGYNHGLRTYEDWDYVLRLAAQPLTWVHSGTEGLAHRASSGLSRQGNLDHVRDELRVLSLNRKLVRCYAGLPFLLATAGKVVAFQSKWWIWTHFRKRGWVQ
jgi:hypothetical protein